MSSAQDPKQQETQLPPSEGLTEGAKQAEPDAAEQAKKVSHDSYMAEMRVPRLGVQLIRIWL
ncbi:hypothetical protein L486_01791 [Kwoniella mangroviensis CBS 10435]|uniref:Uncharacterized protein n=1 Tax=Kwoniella mangroviensis CBS 10435 TaxID=1331196 RepID=A0A1B9J383_9TREE|nr:hypothetical protein L486_01791 [Kwoniella mangroviensis CBS 10435]